MDQYAPTVVNYNYLLAKSCESDGNQITKE